MTSELETPESLQIFAAKWFSIVQHTHDHEKQVWYCALQVGNVTSKQTAVIL